MQIAILGAGVAGVSSAIALAGRGHDVTIYERHPRMSTLGAGITLWPNATFVLAELGVVERVRAVAGRPWVMQRFDMAGQRLGSVDVRSVDDQLGHPTLSVLRRDLHRILLDRLGELGVEVRCGRTVTEVGDRGERDGRAWARFDSGEHVEADLVVGAEGRMSSAARRYVDPHATPVYQGFVNWLGIAASTETILDDPHAILDYWGTGSRFGIVPVAPGRAYWAGGAAMRLDAVDPRHGSVDELERRFAAWPDVIRRIIRASPADTLRTIAVHDLDPMERWHRGPVVVIGDAAHASLPTSGQGACQALEDAWHLARCLPDLARFTELRAAKTRAITMLGRRLASSIFDEDPHACRVRDEQTRQLDHRALVAGMVAQWGAGLPLGQPSSISTR